MQYGRDPEVIQRYSMRFAKVGAVFEEKDEQAESWKDQSVEANGSQSAGNVSI